MFVSIEKLQATTGGLKVWPFRVWDSKQPPVQWCRGVCADMGGCHHILWGRRFQTVWTLYLHLNLDTCTKEYTVMPLV